MYLLILPLSFAFLHIQLLHLQIRFFETSLILQKLNDKEKAKWRDTNNKVTIVAPNPLVSIYLKVSE